MLARMADFLPRFDSGCRSEPGRWARGLSVTCTGTAMAGSRHDQRNPITMTIVR